MGDHNVCPSCGGDTMKPARKGCDTPDWSHVQPDFDGIDPASDDPGRGFPIHEITVTKIAYDEPAASYGIDPTELEYSIDHGRCTWRGEECIVEGTVVDLGLHQAIFGVWSKGEKDERLTERVYKVRGWVSKTDIPGEPVEYDAGIEEVANDDDEVC